MTSPDDPFATPRGSSPSGDAPSGGQESPYGPPPGYAPPPYGPPPGYGPTPSYGPPAGYGPPPQPGQVPSAYWPPAPQTSGTAVAALVLAVGSFLVLPVIPAVVALVLARSASADIDSSGGRVSGSGLVTAARVVAWINLALAALVLLAIVLFVVLAVSLPSGSFTGTLGA